jgi:hypothetical protein
MVKIRPRKKVVKNLENSITSTKLDAVRELRLPGRFTIELDIFLIKSRGHKTMQYIEVNIDIDFET